MPFDINGARSSGYSDDEIADYLASRSSFDIGAARKAGYSSKDIIDFLGSDAAQARPLPQGVTPSSAGAGRGTAPDPRLIRAEAPRMDDLGDPMGTGAAAIQDAQEPAGPLDKPFDYGPNLTDAELAGNNALSRAPWQVQQDQQDSARRLAQGAAEDERARTRKFANANPNLAALGSGAAASLAGLVNAPAAAADYLNQVAVNPALRAAGAPEIGRVGNMPGVDYLQDAAANLMPDVGQGTPSHAWHNDQFLPWLMANMAAQAPQMAQQFAAAYMPGLRPLILPAMGATQAGQSYGTGDSGAAALSKGVIEAGSELLPLHVFDKAKEALLRLPAPARATALALALRNTAAGGAAVTAGTLTEAIEEGASQFGQNLVDRLQGQNTPLNDQVAANMIIGGVMGGAMHGPNAVHALRGGEHGAAAREIAGEIGSGNFAPLGPNDVHLADLNPNLANVPVTVEHLAQAAGGTLTDRGTVSFQQPNSPTAQAGVRPVEVPVAALLPRAAEAPAEEPQTATGREEVYERATRAVNSLLRPGGGAAGADAGAGVGAERPGAADTAGAVGVPAGAPVAAGGTLAPLADGATGGQPAAVAPAQTWLGRSGRGFATTGDAEVARADRARRTPDLEWRVEPIAGGRYQLSGYAPTPIDQAANQAASSPTNALPEPTDAQKEAGNYQKGHVTLGGGLNVSIETPAGGVRRSKEGVEPPWQVTMPAHYGYVRGTLGSDGDHADIFIGPQGDNGRYWVVNQNHADSDAHDEHKIVTGVNSADEAVDLYKRSFADNFGDRVFSSVSGEYNAAGLKAELPNMSQPVAITGGQEASDVSALNGSRLVEQRAAGAPVGAAGAAAAGVGVVERAPAPGMAGQPAGAAGLGGGVLQRAAGTPQPGLAAGAVARGGEGAAGQPALDLAGARVPGAVRGLTPSAVDTTLRTVERDRAKQTGEKVTLRPVAAPSEPHAVAQALGEAFDMPVVWAEAVGRKAGFNGVRLGDTIVLVGHADDAVHAVAMHEVVHGMPDDIRTELIRKVMHTVPAAKRAKFLADFKGYSKLSTSQQDEELTAMLAQQQAKTPEFWRDLRARLGNDAFSRLADYVLGKLDQLIDTFRKRKLDRWTDDPAAVRAALVEAYGQARERVNAHHEAADAFFADDAAFSDRNEKTDLFDSGIKPKPSGMDMHWIIDDPVAARRVLGLPSKGLVTKRMLGEAMDAWRKGKVARDDYGQAAARKLATAIADEITWSMARGNDHGADWYHAKLDRAMAVLAKAEPSLKKRENATLFKLLLAITSDGAEVEDNFSHAMGMYRGHMAGKALMDSLPEGGKYRETYQQNAQLIDDLISERGVGKTLKFLLAPTTAGDAADEAKALDLKTSTISNYPRDVTVPTAAIFLGPKVGAFFANLAGERGYLTMDRWWSRSINRYRGALTAMPTESSLAELRELVGKPRITEERLLEIARDTAKKADKEYKAARERGEKYTKTKLQTLAQTIAKNAFSELNDAPVNAQDRGFQIRVAKEAQRLLADRGHNLDIADLQAALWYYEKELFAAVGVRGPERLSYEEAAIRWVDRSERSDVGAVRQPQPRGQAEARAQDDGRQDALFSERGDSAVIDDAAEHDRDPATARRHPTLVNIGLDVPTGGRLSAPEVITMLKEHGATVLSHTVHTSDSEPTVIARLAQPLPARVAHAVSAALKQQAIAQWDGKAGDLHGPEADQWKPFNADYFMLPDGARLGAVQSARDEALVDDERGVPAPSEAGGQRDQADAGERGRARELVAAAADHGAAGRGAGGPVAGVHYGRVGGLSRLSGSMSGTGIRGAEQERLKLTDDARIKRRSYFYLANSKDDLPQPEAGLGPHIYRADLGGMYDEANASDAERARVRELRNRYVAEGEDRGNAHERAVLDAGFRGYINRDQGTAVVLGDQDVTYHGTRTGQGERARGGYVEPTPAWKYALSSKELDKLDLDALKAAAPSAKVSSGTLRVDGDQADAARAALVKQGIAVPASAAQFSEREQFPSWQPEARRVEKEFFDGDVSKLGQAADAYNAIRNELPWAQRQAFEEKYGIETNGDFGHDVDAVRAAMARAAGFAGYEGAPDVAVHSATGSEPYPVRAGDGYIQVLRNVPDTDGVRTLFVNWSRDASPQEAIDAAAAEARRMELKRVFFGPSSGLLDAATQQGAEQGAISNDPHAYYAARAAALHRASLSRGTTAEQAQAFGKGFADAAVRNRKGGAFTVGRFIDLDRASFSERADDVSPIGLYRELDRRIAAGPKQAPAEQWLAYIKGLQSKGVKADEIEWSGVTDWLRMQQGKVSREAVAEFLHGNGVQVEERQLRSTPPDTLDDPAERAEYEDRTKYGQYTLPGGKNYREVLLTLPRDGKRGMVAEINRAFADGRITEEDRTHYLADPGAFFARGSDVDRATGTFRHSHWEQPNVLAHIRMNDRTDAEGKKVLFVEELQSDWAQQGRKKGFAADAMPAREAFKRAEAEVRAKYESLIRKELAGEIKPAELDEFVIRLMRGMPVGQMARYTGDYDRLVPLQRAEMDEQSAANKKVPAAPFVRNTDAWLTLALKRVVSIAAQEGYDRVAFVNGEQSAERYDLSKQVNSISYTKAGDEYRVRAMPINGDQSVDLGTMPAAGLDDAVGKEVAEKIVRGEGVPSGDSIVLRGLDLKVGGEGMKAFYDSIVPKAAKDVARKLGGEGLREVRFVERDAGTPSAGADLDAEIDRLTADTFGEAATPTRGPSERIVLRQPGFDITPKMREIAERGLPMFSERADHGGDLAEIADSRRSFQFPPVEGKQMGQIVAKLAPKGTTVTARMVDDNKEWRITLPTGEQARITERPYEPEGNSYGFITLPDGTAEEIDERPGRHPEVVDGRADVWIDASGLTGNGEGARFYAIAANYARNNNRVFIGDPAGLSDAALVRRPEQMLSSALKFGTTIHLGPHPRQVLEDNRKLGIPKLDWVYGDHVGNITKLIDNITKVMYNRYPALSDFSFDERSGHFLGPQGEVVRRDGLRAALEAHAPDLFAREATPKAGSDTLARALVWHSLGAAGHEAPGVHGRAGLLARLRSLLSSGRGDTDALFYSERGDDAGDGQAVPAGRDGRDVGEPDAGAVAGGKEPAYSFDLNSIRRAPARAPGLATNGWLLSRDELGRFRFGTGAKVYRAVANVANAVLDRVALKPMSTELKHAVRQMRIEIAQAQDQTAEVAADLAHLSDDERNMLSDIIEGELKAGVTPPKHLLDTAAAISAVMSQQSEELVEAGMLSQEAADKWRDKYLPRFYEKKLGNEVRDAWERAVSTMMGRPAALRGIGGQSLRRRGMTKLVPAAEVADWERQGWAIDDPNFDPAKDDSVMMHRDFTRDERDRMGEIRDAMFRFVFGYMRSQKDLALARLFSHLADTVATRGPTPENQVLVPDAIVEGTGLKRYGKLAGKYVPREVLDHLSGYTEGEYETLLKLYRKGMSLWKEGKTVLNPVAHANNTVSNLTLAHFAGVSYWDWPKYLGAIKDIAKGADMVKEAARAGLFGGTMSEAELLKNMPEQLRILAQKEEPVVARSVERVWDAMSWWLRKPLGKLYQGEDLFFRYLLYRDARLRGLHPNEAIDHATRYIFEYDDLPKGARFIRDTAIPFFSWTYKAVPVMAHTVLNYPWRFAAPMATVFLANSLMYAIAAGEDDKDDWRQAIKKMLTDPAFRQKVYAKMDWEQKMLPPWMQGRSSLGTEKTIRLGTDAATQLPVFLDISRMVPGGDLFDTTPNTMGAMPWLQNLTPSNPLFNTMVMLLANRDMYFGKDVVDLSDTSEEAAKKRGAWLWQQFAPAIAVNGYVWNRSMQAIANITGKTIHWWPDDYTGVGKDGLPVQPGYAAMQNVGIKARPIDLDASQQIEAGQKKALIRELENQIRRLRRLDRIGALSDEQAQQAIDLQREKIGRLRDGADVDGNPQD